MHLDEGTIHAWLDGALDAEEAARVEQHAAECGVCAAAVAEARGLVAGASRILTALDGVPGGIVPKTAASGSAARAKRTRSLWTTLHLTPARAAAAAVVVLAAGTALVLHNAPNAERASIKLADYPRDSVTFQPAAPMVLPHAAPDTAASQTSVRAPDVPMASRVATKKTAQPVPAPSRRAVAGEGGEGRAVERSVAVAQKTKALDAAEVADNVARGAVAGAARPAAAPPSAATQQYGMAKGVADVRSIAGCYVVTTDSGVALPPRLWLDSSLIARPAMLRRTEAAADAFALEGHGVSEMVNDTRRSIAGASWTPRRDGSIRLSLPANALNVDLLPASASTLVGAAATGGRTVSVTLRRAECGP